MNDKFLQKADRNDSLVEFVRYILSSRSSSFPKLSLPELDRDSELPPFLKVEKLMFERHERENKKIKFLNKCLQIAPIYPEKCNKRVAFRYHNRQPEKCSYFNLSNKKSNLSLNQKANLNGNFSSGLICKSITPLRERICLACRKNSLLRHNNQKKNKYTEKNQNSILDYSKVAMHDNKMFAMNELFQKLLNTNSAILNSVFEEDKKVLEPFKRTNDSLKINNCISKNVINDNLADGQIKEMFQQMSISLNNSEINEESHSRHSMKKYLQLLNTDPISLKNKSLATILSIERLSI
ncbi:unnamed protein product [Cryptosporidium hominis]|uniref:Uncharacterized protein n=1 Tax=Cryptosporidium hominis TaxID=237895 RepID=A0A0S4TBP4_CRYHO|nr:hypothetical protein [Cryptosporidium hominis TU502]OLQ19138.1 hypothetical protein ChTU502y2012_418g0385 [Cryptosporidium hominis]PPA65810.1 hypothetical protein ChUKH1_14720 [Cryptosporidium hominis]PPS95163.1 Uncharacterized protein GY17_00002088 [Cryptosporidium hominis]CUV04492.1 unnamed protein product [Cryptosporidium hominis]|eukprot:PPS95163.1 Uncharacterized protein GY17_00002088 [Cryptosporidium hominis]